MTAITSTPIAARLGMPRPLRARVTTPSKQRDVASRWTPALAEQGWTPIVDAFLDHYAALDVTNAEAIFLVHLMRHKWDAKMPYPGMNGLAAKMGVTPTSARNYARDLEEKGLIKRINRPGKTTAFDLTPLFKALEREVERCSSPTKGRRISRPKVTTELPPLPEAIS